MELTHWEYCFYQHTCHLGDRVRKATNPFTGEPVEFPIDDGLTAGECDDVRRVFEKFEVQGPEPHGEGYALYLPENESVRFRGGPDIDDPDGVPLVGFSVEIVVKNLSDDVLALVLDVARQGNLAFVSSTGESSALVNASNDPRIQKRWPNAGVIGTNNALRSWLESNIDRRRLHVPEGDCN